MLASTPSGAMESGLVSDPKFGAKRWFLTVKVHGMIPSSNVLCVVPMESLLQTMSETASPFYTHAFQDAVTTRGVRNAIKRNLQSTLTYADGLSLGRLLLSLGIPSRHIEAVCTTILQDWGYPEARKAVWLLNKEFVQGQDHGYQDITQSVGFTNLSNQMAQGKEHHLGQSPTHQATEVISQHSSNDGPEFADFLAQLEEAAFGNTGQPNTPKLGARSELTLKAEPTDQLYVKEESPDCVVPNMTHA